MRQISINKNLQLFSTFAKMSAVTFGGGYAMMPLCERELVEKRHWCEQEEIADFYAVGQTTPGVVALTVAGLVGTRVNGFIGACAAIFGMSFPSLVLVTLIGALLTQNLDNPFIAAALGGTGTAVCALLTVTVFKLARGCVVDMTTLVIFSAAFAVLMLGMPPVWVVATAAFFGVLYGRKTNNIFAKLSRLRDKRK
ncbi:MAG: chromate transporter [Oscillospiraceae bacterium]|jgi:chromate transporter|nr:chromate transporter [Oscillospiraceae bacterium]